ncbi:hypothetical protein [Streptomyces sp. NPDC004788]
MQHQLSGELATMQPDPTGRVLAMAENIQVTLSDADRERLDKLATVRKDEAVWEHERKWEQSKRAYLGEDVLTSTGSAVVWWLARNDDQVDKAVADIGLLAQLTSVANGRPVPEQLRRYVDGPQAEWSSGEEAAEEEGERRAGTLADAFVQMMDDAGLGAEDPRRTLLLRRMAEATRAAQMPGAETLEQLADEAECPYRASDEEDGEVGEAAKPDDHEDGGGDDFRAL